MERSGRARMVSSRARRRVTRVGRYAEVPGSRAGTAVVHRCVRSQAIQGLTGGAPQSHG